MTAAPAVFLPYQQELMASAAINPVTVVEKSRRTGYSWGAGAIGVMTASATRAADGMSVYYMGYDLEMAREFIDYCGTWAKQLQAGASAMQETIFRDPENPEKDVKAFRVEFASGYEIVALPSVPRALRGKQGLVIIDEAAFHGDLMAVLKAALALLMWGGRVLIISTHNGDENPFNALVQDIRAGKKPYTLLRCTFDEALAQGLYKRICHVRGLEWSPAAEAAWRAELIAQYGDAADEELFCVPREGGGVAIPRALIEKRMVVNGPVLTFACNDRFVHYAEHIRVADTRVWLEEHIKPLIEAMDADIPVAVGQDFGRKGDLSVLAPLQILKSLVRRAPFILQLRNVPYEQQKQIFCWICDRLHLRAAKLDATGNGGYLGEAAMQRYGETRVEAVMMSEPWYRENMPALKAAFEDGTIELPPDRDVLDDLALLAYVRGVIRVPERTLGSDGKGRHGDAAIALALAYAASRADPEIYEVEAAPLGAPAARGTGWDARRQELLDEDDRQVAPGGFMPVLQGDFLPGRIGGAA